VLGSSAPPHSIAPKLAAVGSRATIVPAMPALNNEVKDETVMLGSWEAPVAAAFPPPRMLDPADIQLLTNRGEQFMAAGDVAAARVALKRAAEAGDSGAALALAGSYDPRILSRIGVVGVTADPDEASNWYRKAEQFGSPEALRQMSCFRIDNCARDAALENLLHRTCL